MNEAHKISRRLDAARDGKVHVEEATDRELSRVYVGKPVLMRESLHVESRRKAKEERNAG